MNDTADPLTDVFDALRLTGGLYFAADLRGDFAVAVPPDRDTIRFHLGLSGSCGVAVPGFPPETLSAGDWAIVPHGVTQTLFRGRAGQPMPLSAALARGRLSPEGRFHLGTDGARTELLCGFCEFRSGYSHPLLTQLPPMLILRRTEIEADAALSAISAILVAEAGAGQGGRTAILTRTIETLFLLVIRRMTDAAQGASGGFVSVLADERLGRSVRAMHSRPEKPWTLPDLARMAGMSRSAFAEAFAEKAGMGPAAYLRLWRMIRARELLRGTDLDVAEIAARCGYESLPSFSARFKRETGLGPGAYRRGAKA